MVIATENPLSLSGPICYLKARGYVRTEDQTHREFATTISSDYKVRGSWQQIHERVHLLTERSTQSFRITMVEYLGSKTT